MAQSNKRIGQISKSLIKATKKALNLIYNTTLMRLSRLKPTKGSLVANITNEAAKNSVLTQSAWASFGPAGFATIRSATNKK